MIEDYDQRTQAVDPTRSFIVQAPAGSGKTELLTQRFLKLLSTVSAPEQLVALTFTRKAANEMRERILLALQQAAEGAKPESPHQERTYAFAADALAQDKQHGWKLLQQPSRLRVITIDSLCQSLAHAIPSQDKQIPYAQISDKPQRHYLAAARACLQYAMNAPEYHDALTLLLDHLDNQQDTLLALFSQLLANRDQWLERFYQAREQDKSDYEDALAWIEQHEIARFYQSLPFHLKDELFDLTRRVACIENKPDSPRYPLQYWEDVDDLNGELAAALAALLLTSQHTFRKSFDHHVGLKRGLCDDNTYDDIKQRSKRLLRDFELLPDFLDALNRVKQLPAPEYDETQWAVLQALFTLLPLLAAHLHMVFHEHNEVDFSAIAQQALTALGDDEHPTELVLYLDNTIHHLLVDEFQDTSIHQFQLLSKLVQGWEPHQHRTLFIVGDPMQSIYRFRQAEVGLFLRAKQQGIGPVRLTFLELCCNFRSTNGLITWVNQHFKTIFPAIDDIESGAVSFHPSISIKSSDEAAIHAFQLENKEAEADALVTLITTQLETYPTDNLAILVRSRTQLSAIMRLLRERAIPFQGVDIDLLAQLPHLRDVWSLTQALLMPANRLVWLEFLRSPWCGLTLHDLHCIANVDKHKSIYLALSNVERINGLSEDGQQRTRYIYRIMKEALDTRHQHPLTDWLLSTLKRLHMEQILDESQHDDLEQYWSLLQQFEENGRIANLEEFKTEFNKLYSKRVTPSRLQIMTIHKSKGLEFDSVLLPALGARPPAPDTPLIRWLTLPTTEHNELLLLSPMKAVYDTQCILYDYLGKLDLEKSDYELQRLLYVAVTRAKKRLFLFDHTEKASKSSFRHLLRHQPFVVQEAAVLTEQTRELPVLWRLPIDFYSELPVSTATQFNALSDPLTDHKPRLIGIAAHELLQWICTTHPINTDTIPWGIARHSLLSMGFNGTELHAAESLLKKQIINFMGSSTGKWIAKSHDDEQNEYELLIEDHQVVSTRIIDRTFYENGIRFIIDFKTGHEHETAIASHRKQVNDYARQLSKRWKEPIRCGLYYLTTGHWICWDWG